jgi:predicted PurR-regulated permease PerM
VFLLLLTMLWGIFRLSAPSFGRQIAELQNQWPRYLNTLVQTVTDAEQYYRERLPPSLRPAVDSWVEDAANALTNTAKRGLGVTVHGVGFAIEMFLVPVLVFYFLADGPSIRRQALFFVPQRYLARTERALDQSDDIFQRYIKGQIVLCAIAFGAVALGLWALDIDFYLLLGAGAGLTRAVPIIGPIVGGLPIIAVILLTTKSLALAFWVIVAFALMHFLESKFLMPAVLGQQLDLHPVLVIVALLVGMQMGGLLGVFLAAPVLAAIKTLVRQRREQRTRRPDGVRNGV